MNSYKRIPRAEEGSVCAGATTTSYGLCETPVAIIVTSITPEVSFPEKSDCVNATSITILQYNNTYDSETATPLKCFNVVYIQR